jgi:hypothetical protein
MKAKFNDKAYIIFTHRNTKIQIPKQALHSYMTQCMASPSHTKMHDLQCNVLVIP